MSLAKGSYKNVKTIIIDSSERISGTPVNFVSRIPTSIFTRIPYGVRLKQVILPLTFYKVNTSNNLFTLIETGPTIITVTPGNYNQNSLASTIQTLMNAATTIGNVYTVTFDSIIQKYTISGTLPFSLNFNITNSLGKVIGFNTQTTISSTTHIAPDIINLAYDKHLYLECPGLAGGLDNGFIIINRTTTVSLNCLSMIPILYDYGFINLYESPFEIPYINIEQSTFVDGIKNKLATIDLTFTLVSPTGVVLNLNGHDWTFSLEFTYEQA